NGSPRKLRPQRVDNRRVGERTVLLETGTLEHEEPFTPCPPRRLLEHPRLADTCIARNQQTAATALSCFMQHRCEDLDLACTTDQDRRDRDRFRRARRVGPGWCHVVEYETATAVPPVGFKRPATATTCVERVIDVSGSTRPRGHQCPRSRQHCT